MPSLTNARLYGILDTGYVPPEKLLETAKHMVRGGIDVIQLRAKNLPSAAVESIARALRPATEAARVPLIINDHPEIAARVGADGVHVGQDDLSIGEARHRIRCEAATGSSVTLVGKSTHSREQALAAVEEGADYIGFGPLFATPTKPDYPAIGLEDVAWVHEHVEIPIFCIGGIKKENVQAVIDAGAKRVVIVSGILCAEDIPRYIADVKSILPPL